MVRTLSPGLVTSPLCRYLASLGRPSLVPFDPCFSRTVSTFCVQPPSSPPRPSTSIPLGITGPSRSPRFRLYQSSIGSTLPVMSSNTPELRDAVSHAQGTLDLAPLRSQVLVRHAPDKTLCPFEIPGGGMCVDPGCFYAHLRDLEPSDAETANYLAGIFTSFHVGQMSAALGSGRASIGGRDLKSRVIDALDKLGLR